MDISVYTNQFGSYCEAYNIKQEKKVPLFLTNIWHGSFSILKDLCAPDKVQDQSFEEIHDTLKHHFTTKRNIIVERYNSTRSDRHLSKQKPSF